MHSVCKSTHQCASFADLEAGNRDHAKLNQAANILRDSFSKSVNDRKEYKSDAPYGEEGSKKAGVLGIVNELFAIYFTLNTLRLCMNIIRPVEQRSLHDAGPISHKVTYRYYVGRLNLYEDNYDGAEANLEYAFTNCHKDAIRNKRCILRYLIPVKLYRAKLPSPECKWRCCECLRHFLFCCYCCSTPDLLVLSLPVLEKYQLHEFTMLTESLRTGDLKKLNAALSDHQDRFIRQGTLLLLERCKAICYRNLFKRIHLIADKHIILLKQVVIVFKWLEMDIDLDEVECILANLIHRGIVRGYLHHMKRALVLSKRDPFPVAALPGK